MYVNIGDIGEFSRVRGDDEKHPSRGFYAELQGFSDISRATLFFKEGSGSDTSESENNRMGFSKSEKSQD